MGFSAVIVAAGASSRAGQGPRKPWRRLGTRAVAAWSLEALQSAGAAPIVLVVSREDMALGEALVGAASTCIVVAGGETRAQSVRAGLAALSGVPADTIVLVHDAARPFVTERHVLAVVDAVGAADGAVPALPIPDTLKRADPAGATSTVAREGLHRAQTPQAFRLGVLRDAYAAWTPSDGEPTDDAQVVERAGGRVVLAPGDPDVDEADLPGGLRHGRGARPLRVGHPCRSGLRCSPLRARRPGHALWGVAFRTISRWSDTLTPTLAFTR